MVSMKIVKSILISRDYNVMNEHKSLIVYLENFILGKNNVHVLPKEGNDPVPGYLSLHQAAIGGFGCIKWSPNR